MLSMGALNARPSVLWATAIVGALLASCTVAHPASCPAAGPDHTVTFSDGAILMRTPLAVNPDGAAASYVPGDHGYTYIANGVNLRDHGSKVSCSAAGNGPRCRAAWAEVEAGAFGQGTPEFCVFAMDV